MTATVLSDQTYAPAARTARSYRSEKSAQSAPQAQPQAQRLSRIGKISKTAIALWVTQVLLGALFLFAGPIKFFLPPEILASGPVVFPLAFIYFIGTCETLGGLGLLLPGISRIWTRLTPLAASGLVIIMIGATVTTAIGGDLLPALFPAVVGLLCAFVAYGRSRLAPHRTTWRRAPYLTTSSPRVAIAPTPAPVAAYYSGALRPAA